jgi:nucleotide-binding universal stress UspA family protein
MDDAIVVGVDGSAGSIGALRWAADEARLRNATLEVITTWTQPPAVYLRGGDLPIPAGFGDELERNAKEVQAAALAEASPDEAVRLETRVVEGQAASVLIQAGEHAQMLVVGSRGLGGFRELLLGSVSHACAHHASCPVVIVRSRRSKAPSG